MLFGKSYLFTEAFYSMKKWAINLAGGHFEKAAFSG